MDEIHVDATVLDWAVVDQHLELATGKALTQYLVDHVRADAPVQVLLLHQAVGRGDRQQVAAIAHRLLGTARSLGLLRVMAACSDIELRALRDEAWRAPDLLAVLEQAIQTSDAALRSIEARLRADS